MMILPLYIYVYMYIMGAWCYWMSFAWSPFAILCWHPAKDTLQKMCLDALLVEVFLLQGPTE